VREKFADKISNDMEWRKWICKHQGKWLVCECEAGAACHADALVTEYVAQFSPAAVDARRQQSLETETVPARGSVAAHMGEQPGEASSSSKDARREPVTREEIKSHTSRRFTVKGYRGKSAGKGEKRKKGKGKGKAKTPATTTPRMLPTKLGKTAKSFAAGGRGRGWVIIET